MGFQEKIIVRQSVIYQKNMAQSIALCHVFLYNKCLLFQTQEKILDVANNEGEVTFTGVNGSTLQFTATGREA